MARARLIVWNQVEADERAEGLRRQGHEVDASPLSPEAMRSLRSAPPDVVVIDLGRAPSQGRDLGIWLRKTVATRGVPLVFVGGSPEKVSRVRDHLPDAVYTEWPDVADAVSGALANPLERPVVPSSVMAAYSGTPLPKKLGVKAGSAVALIDPPEGFDETLGRLPEGVSLQRKAAASGADLAIWFVRQASALEAGIDAVAADLGTGGLWVAWPKKSSLLASDLTQQVVRSVGLAHGLVDFKVCAIDETWSGLRFARRRG